MRYPNIVATIARLREYRWFDRSVAKDMSDGVLGYFGYPEPHREDVKQALRGARCGHPGDRQARCLGAPELHIGGLVVSDLIGPGVPQQDGAGGTTRAKPAASNAATVR
jgi:hypothetical protein